MNALFKIFIIISINVGILISQCNSIDNASLPRDGSNGVLVGEKIYYIGGRTASPQKVNTFLLSLSSDFTATDPNFVQVSGLENMPLPVWTAACLEKDNTIYIFGGTVASQPSLPKANTLYKIKPTSNDTFLNWTTSSPSQGDNTWPSARDGIIPIIDNDSRIFVWGGRNDGQDNKTTYMFEANKWSNLGNGPNPRSSYSATLLNDGEIVYIGGISRSPYPDVKFLEVSTSDKQIKNRFGHSALLHLDSISIIMYGGLYYPIEEIPDSDSVWILNTKNWTWSRQSVPSLPSITVTRDHSAVMYNGYMIIAFVNKNYSYTYEVKVMDVADLNSLAWVPTYKVRKLPSTSSNSSGTNTNPSGTNVNTSTTTDGTKKSKLGLILGVAIGGAIVGCLIALTLVVFFVRRHKLHSSTATEVSNVRISEYSAHEPVSAIVSTYNSDPSRPNSAYQQYNTNLPSANQYSPNLAEIQSVNPKLPANQFSLNLAEIQSVNPNPPRNQYSPNPSANQYLYSNMQTRYQDGNGNWI
ncbi:10794_t:CDS:2 [Ambispora gerdemannii]|uniref:10794_t:CDS:1 n=1 Tax=Ambispora gerdemannii TaxID=144530 RepID=A0A9N9C1J5_9GLOM|nr:10794_t:CDS:2 [Ambispora gerdemannii]